MYDFFALLKEKKFDRETYSSFKTNDNLYYLHSKRDKVLNKKPGGNASLYFSNNKKNYDLSEDDFFKSIEIEDSTYIRIFPFEIKITSSFFTASENSFYSIANPIAKDRPTGLPLLKGSSLKGALRQAAVDIIESKLLNKNYGDNFKKYEDKETDEIVNSEEKDNDRFFFKKRSQLVKLFGNERDTKWFTFKSLLATGGINDISNVGKILKRINDAFEHYLKKHRIVNSEGVCRGRLILEDLHFKKVSLDVITPLDRKKRTPVHGPIFYEIVPEGEIITGKLTWFPFDLIAKGKVEKVEDEWQEDKSMIKEAFKKLSERGIGAKTKNGWGRFNWEAINES